MKNILWSVDPRDWDTRDNTVDNMSKLVLENLHSEAIILFHDGGGTERKNSAEALKKIIPECLKQGYEFVTIDKLIKIDYQL
ncbi:MAG: hypothetical protein GY951_05330 [Psychromonas sp.]|nr:hypothetical protein [Psychromonas sp.]